MTQHIQGWPSIRIAGSGQLTEPEAGHEPGSSYVVIQVDNAMNRDIARKLLRDCTGTTDLAWDFGWAGRYLDDGERVTELTLYPVASSRTR